MNDKTILVIGTFDTKNDELSYICECIKRQGGNTLSIDVSVLGEPEKPTDYSKHQVAEEGDSSISAAIESGDENTAMQIMAVGAALLVSRLYLEGKFEGLIVLGGTMGTDLALDVTNAVPLGVPKYIVSTISFSPLIPAGRLAADTQMILWAGGLYGLNSICKSSLSQAAGAVLGAARAVEKPDAARPIIGMTSLGLSGLKYMSFLKPELEKRGFDVAVFHATGMGGRAFESLASQNAFVCVFDFCTQELGNHIHGSNISAGEDRLTNAGLRGIPQLVAPGCYDLVDIVGWQDSPQKWAEHPAHAHNRLLSSIVLDVGERREVAHAHSRQLSSANGPVTLLLPTQGCGEWDRPGNNLHDADGLAAFCEETIKTCPSNVDLKILDCHINDEVFCEAALIVLDQWMLNGIVQDPLDQ
ncbi:MAG: Tm-1-like ATP-binding domain-containing protein [Cohaesibacteraceae bacterium]|nr:Tm-1-like ATP-binding domain-containing protein [Cohaesibacteraceae bacterium]MBL4875223.1 Tm-1-like ATP-binding domain-containing protein [Cohaesibacteraceae bacterium]